MLPICALLLAYYWVYRRRDGGEGGAVENKAEDSDKDGVKYGDMVALAPQMNITFIVRAGVVVVGGVGAIGLGYVIYKQRCLDNSLQNTLANKRALETKVKCLLNMVCKSLQHSRALEHQVKCLQNEMNKLLQHSRALDYKLEDLQNVVKKVLEHYPLLGGLEDDVTGELLHLLSTILEHGVNIQNGVLPR